MSLERFNSADFDPVSLAVRLKVRMNRQRILERETDVPQLEVIIGGAAFLHIAGSSQTMIGQLEHLLMDFPPLAEGRLVEPTQVYVDGYSAFYMSADPAEVGKYRRAWPSMRETALSESASREFLKRRIADLS